MLRLGKARSVAAWLVRAARFNYLLAAFVLALTVGPANAATLTVSNTTPYSINQLNSGDSGDQIVTNTIANTFGGLNFYWISSSMSVVFNYSIVYSPTSLAFAAAEVFEVLPSLNFSPFQGGCYPYCGTFLAFNRNMGTSPSAPITVTGSISMDAGLLYLLEVGLYNYSQNGPYMVFPVSPNGSYDLAWNVATTPSYSSVLSAQGGDPSYVFTPPPGVPLPAAFPLFATGLGMMGLLGWRRKRKALAKAAAA
jgi:hypothetical protein